MGGDDRLFQGKRESTVKYHSLLMSYLTFIREPEKEQCRGVSLTGAVSSERVTEDYEGLLTPVGNRKQSI